MRRNMEINDAIAIVTGAASGLGAATSAFLADRGARVVGLDRRVDDAPEVSGVRYIACDVTDGEEVRDAVAAAASGGPLRIVVSCAGIAPSARLVGGQGVHSLDLYAEVVRVNLIGTFFVLALAAEEMARNEALADGQRGVVVNTASIAAYEAQIGQVAYASSKGGVAAMTLPAARDLARHGIRVNAIAPGIVDTPMLATVGKEIRAGLAAGVPFPQRLCRPDEYARLVGALIDNDYLNGETIRLDGALRMAPR